MSLERQNSGLTTSHFFPNISALEHRLYRHCACARRWRQNQKESLNRVAERYERTLRAVTHVDAFFSLEPDPNGGPLAKSTLLGLMNATGCSADDIAALDELFDEIDGNKNGVVSFEEWLTFRDFKLHGSGDHAPLIIKALRTADVFKAEAWDGWEKLQSGSAVGGVLTLLVLAGLCAVIVSSAISFWNDVNTVVTQQVSENPYELAEIPEFFLYFRTRGFANIFDPSLFTFQMSYYIKSMNASNGQPIEVYRTVPVKKAGPADISWWPAAVPRSFMVATPKEGINIVGAYHLDFFRQLEIKLTPCQNATGATVCRSAQEISDALHGGSVNMVIRSEDVGYSRTRQQYWIIKIGQTKQVDLYFQRRDVIIAGKYPLAAKEHKRVLPFTHATEQNALPWSSGTMIVWWFQQGGDKVVETRQREDISALFAVWAGTWATLATTLGLLAIGYNKQHLQIVVAKNRMRQYQQTDVRIAAISNRRAAWFDRVPERARPSSRTRFGEAGVTISRGDSGVQEVVTKKASDGNQSLQSFPTSAGLILAPAISLASAFSEEQHHEAAQHMMADDADVMPEFNIKGDLDEAASGALALLEQTRQSAHRNSGKSAWTQPEATLHTASPDMNSPSLRAVADLDDIALKAALYDDDGFVLKEATQIDLPDGTRVMVDFGILCQSGTILQGGIGPLHGKFQVCFDQDDRSSWVEYWRCTAIAPKDDVTSI